MIIHIINELITPSRYLRTGNSRIKRYNYAWGIVMKKIILALCVFILGLAAAKVFFGVDVEGLFEGFFEFIGGILDGPG